MSAQSSVVNRLGAQPNLWEKLTHDRWLRFLLLVPVVGILGVFSIYPLIYAFYTSLFNYNKTTSKITTFAGIDNYLKLAQDQAFWNSVGVTLFFAAVVIIVELVVGLILALMLNEEIRFRGFYRTGLILPMVVAPVVVGIIFRLLYDFDFGLPNYILENILHLKRVDWLGNADVALYSMMIMDIWQWTSFMFLTLLAGLQAIPVDLYEAARVDGANPWQGFRFITLPMLRATMLVALLIRTMDALRFFDQVFVTTQGGPGATTEVVSFYIYKTAFRFSQPTYAAALIMVLLLITLLISIVYMRLLRTRQVAE